MVSKSILSILLFSRAEENARILFMPCSCLWLLRLELLSWVSLKWERKNAAMVVVLSMHFFFLFWEPHCVRYFAITVETDGT